MKRSFHVFYDRDDGYCLSEMLVDADENTIDSWEYMAEIKKCAHKLPSAPGEQRWASFSLEDSKAVEQIKTIPAELQRYFSDSRALEMGKDYVFTVPPPPPDMRTQEPVQLLKQVKPRTRRMSA